MSILLFEEFVNESFKNFIGFDDETLEEKRKWTDDVWHILQLSYKAIGGVKGSGFESKESMIRNIPFWKLRTIKGELKYVILYKDSKGRKLVALGTDGSRIATQLLKKDQEEELKRSFGERSGPALNFTLKSVPFNILKDYIKTPEEAQRIMPTKTIIPLSEFGVDSLNKHDKVTYDKFNHLLEPYFYVRELGEEYHLKVLFGSVKELQI